ncbi:MAG: peptide chain release factor N(5)-glutamine methyltransferase [Kiritimatiellales bacterium]
MNNLIKQLEARLAAAGSGNAKRAVEELAANVLGCKPLEIYFKTITPEQQAELEKLIVRAEQGEPIQYIIGHVDFRGLEIHCDRRALIPRPETEQLVQAVLENVDATPSSRSNKGKRDEGVASTLKIADIGTGTGCIALSLLHELPNAEVIGVDISPDALVLARENAERLGLSDRFQTLESDLLGAFMVDAASCRVMQRQDAAATMGERFDIIVSNPPYIVSKVCKNLDRSVRDFEPKLALDGGEDGLDLIRPLVEQAARALKPGGGLFLEIGYDQGEAVANCLRAACPQQRATRENAGFQNVRIIKDIAGLDRIVTGFRP